MAENERKGREEIRREAQQREITPRDIFIELQDLKQDIAAVNPEIGTRQDIKTLANSIRDLSNRVEKIENHLGESRKEEEKREKPEDELEEEPKF